MWKTTGDVKWRERGYAIFEAIEKHSRTEYGYASVGSVGYPPYSKIDDMPRYCAAHSSIVARLTSVLSYFLAETLKYLYLLFDDEDPISLDKWVFNTEAHPLPVFEWSTWEKELYKPWYSGLGHYSFCIYYLWVIYGVLIINPNDFNGYTSHLKKIGMAHILGVQIWCSKIYT